MFFYIRLKVVPLATQPADNQTQNQPAAWKTPVDFYIKPASIQIL